MTTSLVVGPSKVVSLDVVGYLGDGKFVILNPYKSPNRKLPPLPDQQLPYCIPCTIENNQIVNFSGKIATLHNIGDEWHYKLQHRGSVLEPLSSHMFFEIGNSK